MPVVYVAVFVGVFEEVGARGVEVGAQAVEVERRCETDGTGGDSEVAGEVGVAEEDEFAVAGLRDGTRACDGADEGRGGAVGDGKREVAVAGDNASARKRVEFDGLVAGEARLVALVSASLAHSVARAGRESHRRDVKRSGDIQGGETVETQRAGY